MSDKPVSPPRWPERMLRWLCSEEHADILIGDLYELYEYRLETKGRGWGRFHYIKDAFDMLRPFAFKNRSLFHNQLNNTLAMFKNYFKISLRNMLRHKVYAGINIFGLSVGIACFLLISLYVQDEFSYDRYHEHADDIYRVMVENFDADGVSSRVFGYSSAKHGEALREYPQVASAVRFYPFNFPLVKHREKQFEEYYFNFVEPQIFDVFSFDFKEGVPDKALSEPYSVVITESTATKYFGDEPAYGKVLTVVDREEAFYKVTGVVRDFPEQSHMDYNFLASWSTYEAINGVEALQDFSGDYNYPTYIRLADGARVEDLATQMPAMFDTHIDNVQGDKPSSRLGILFQKLTDIHLEGTPGSSNGNGLYYIYLFSGIGILVLVIACINYMNLSTAKYTNRLKEVGVRKVMGARARQVSQQFLVESTFYVVLAMMVSVGFIFLLLPSVNDFAEKQLVFNPLANWTLGVMMITIVLVVGILAGSYPSFFMSKFRAVKALKGGKLFRSKKSVFRTGLVVFQFTLTIGLIITVVVVQSQLNFIHNQDPGFDREQVVTFWGSDAINRQLPDFKSRIEANPNVQKVSAASRVPTGRLADSMEASLYNDETEQRVDFRLPYLTVDVDYMDLYSLELVAGDWFGETIPSDSSQHFIINEVAAKRLGFQNADAALGQRMSYGNYRGFIGGVLKDFHFESLRSRIQPMLMVNADRDKHVISAKIAPTNIMETMAFLEEEFVRLNPGRTFDGAFLDESFDWQYRKEQRLSTASTAFSVMAIVIACLGLLGLVGFTMEQRAKELSVRKVLGASVAGILVLVNKRYVMLIGIAFLIAVPVAWYLLSDWLNTFAYHVNIGAGVILLSGLIAILIAVLTICAQALKVAMESPVRYLRNE